jgi:hypothetical protein
LVNSPARIERDYFRPFMPKSANRAATGCLPEEFIAVTAT